MNYTLCYKSVCQNCDNVFSISRRMINTINIDEDSDEFINLLVSSINKVTCPACKTQYTHEIPLLVFSVKQKFAVLTGSKTPDIIPSFFKIFDFSYRKVDYFIEALEKVRIFCDGLDDRYIEHLKKAYFDDSDATPTKDINLCYKHSDKNNVIFEKLDCNGKLIKEFSLPVKDLHIPSFAEDKKELIWHEINRNTIDNYVIKEKTK